jgi:hypothetical protein
LITRRCSTYPNELQVDAMHHEVKK